jgi:hypothetical protein
MTTISSGQTSTSVPGETGDVVLSGGFLSAASTDFSDIIRGGTEQVFEFGGTASSIDPTLSGGVLFDGGFVSGAVIRAAFCSTERSRTTRS